MALTVQCSSFDKGKSSRNLVLPTTGAHAQIKNIVFSSQPSITGLDINGWVK